MNTIQPSLTPKTSLTPNINESNQRQRLTKSKKRRRSTIITSQQTQEATSNSKTKGNLNIKALIPVADSVLSIDQKAKNRPFPQVQNPNSKLKLEDLRPGDIVMVCYDPKGIEDWITMPQFMGYVPKFLRDIGASALIQLIKGVSIVHNAFHGHKLANLDYNHTAIVIAADIEHVVLADAVYPHARTRKYTKKELLSSTKALDIFRHPDDSFAKNIAQTAASWSLDKDPPRYPLPWGYLKMAVLPLLPRSLVARWDQPKGVYQSTKFCSPPQWQASTESMVCSHFVGAVIKAASDEIQYNTTDNIPFLTLPYELPKQLQQSSFVAIGTVNRSQTTPKELAVAARHMVLKKRMKSRQLQSVAKDLPAQGASGAFLNSLYRIAIYGLSRVIKSPVLDEHSRDRTLLASFDPILEQIRAYHDHEVLGLENLPQKGPFILALQHTSSSYPVAMFDYVLRHERGIYARTMVANAVLMTPAYGPFTKNLLGAIAANRKNGDHALQKGEPIAVCPGGIAALIRPYDERFSPDLKGHSGFVRMAIAHGVPIIPVVCPNGDEVLRSVANPITQFLYRTLNIGLPLLSGFKGTPLPEQKKLIHVIGEPLYFGKSSKPTQSRIDRAYQSVENAMDEAIARGLSHGS